MKGRLLFLEEGEAAPAAAAFAATKVFSHKTSPLPSVLALAVEMYRIKSLVTQRNLTQDPTRNSASQLFPPESEPLSHSMMVIFFKGKISHL